MRAYYALALASAAVAALSDAVEVSRDDTEVYLLSAVDPNPSIADAKGVRLGGSLDELTPEDRAHFTQTLVARTDATSGDVEWLQVPTTQVLATDENLGEPPTPRVVFAGDDPTAY